MTTPDDTVAAEDHEIRVEYMRLDELHPDPRNPKAHSLPDIDASMDRFGYTEPVLLDERTGLLVAGHGRVESAQGRKARGEAPPRGVKIDPDGAWLLPVARGWSSVDDTDAGAYLVASNRLTEKGGWLDDPLGQLLTGLRAEDRLGGTGYDGADVDALLASLATVHVDEHERAPAEPREPADVQQRVAPGDVWALGPHRLMCGDSRTIEPPHDLRAVVTDPPYGMGLDTSWMGGPAGGPSQFQGDGAVSWDAEPFDPSPFVGWSPHVAMFGADWYHHRLPEGGTWWVWDKRCSPGAPPVPMVTGLAYELVWIKGKRAHRMIRHLWGGIVKESGSPGDERTTAHPTQKPVAVMEQIIDYLTAPGDLVADPFAGAGSTLIAADRLDRRCWAVEQDPRYCDVILDRWERHGGTAPVKVEQ